MNKHIAQIILSVFSSILLISCSSDASVPYSNYKEYPKKGIHTVTNAIPKIEPKSRYGNPESYEVFGKRYFVLDTSLDYRAQGIASWYGPKFHGKRTSSGEPYNMFAMTAAHKTLPLPTYAKVRNVENNKTIIVKINDRGPFKDERIIDLSYAAAHKLGVVNQGLAKVEVIAIPTQQASNF